MATCISCERELNFADRMHHNSFDGKCRECRLIKSQASELNSVINAILLTTALAPT